MEFYLKKLIAAFLEPLPIFVLLMVIGMLVLWWFRHVRSASRFLTLALIWLLIFSLFPFPDYLLRSLESRYPPLTRMPKHTHTIVVLGGGVRNNTEFPANTQLSSASIARLMEALRLHRSKPNSQIILSGGRVFNSPSESVAMNNLAIALGVRPANLLIENGSRDTYHEAKYLRKRLGKRPFVLVTSAVHMPRAMALFEAQGLHPIAAPAQYLAKSHTMLMDWIPNAVNLLHADIALHEYIGMTWAFLKGQI